MPNPSGAGTTDANGQWTLALAESPNGWAGDCWKYAGPLTVSANGYATVDVPISTGCVTGDVDINVTMRPSTTGQPGSGNPAVGLPNINVTSFILPVAILVAVGVIAYLVYRHYTNPEVKAKREARKADSTANRGRALSTALLLA